MCDSKVISKSFYLILRKLVKHRLIVLIPLVILLAGTLSACDPMAVAYLTVERVIIIDKIPYIKVSEYQSWGVGNGGVNEPKSHYYVSEDQGKTWQLASSIPPDTSEEEDRPKNHIETCVPNDNKVCYQIAGKEEIEISYDGGKTWQVDWEMPSGRVKYMERVLEATTPIYGVTPDTVPLDLGVITTMDSHSVIVAMGNQGVLVKSLSGVWERYGIQSDKFLGTPIPYSASTFKDATQVLEKEANFVLVLALLFIIFLSLSAWGNIKKNADQTLENKIRQAYLPTKIVFGGLVGFVFLVILTFLLPPLQDSFIGDLIFILLFEPPIILILVPIIGILVSWILIIMTTPQRRFGIFAALATLGYTVAFGIGITSPFILWAFGAIPIYEIAFASSIALGILAAIIGLHHEKRLSFQAISQ